MKTIPESILKELPALRLFLEVSPIATPYALLLSAYMKKLQNDGDSLTRGKAGSEAKAFLAGLKLVGAGEGVIPELEAVASLLNYDAAVIRRGLQTCMLKQVGEAKRVRDAKRLFSPASLSPSSVTPRTSQTALS